MSQKFCWLGFRFWRFDEGELGFVAVLGLVTLDVGLFLLVLYFRVSGVGSWMVGAIWGGVDGGGRGTLFFFWGGGFHKFWEWECLVLGSLCRNFLWSGL